MSDVADLLITKKIIGGLTIYGQKHEASCNLTY